MAAAAACAETSSWRLLGSSCPSGAGVHALQAGQPLELQVDLRDAYGNPAGEWSVFATRLGFVKMFTLTACWWPDSIDGLGLSLCHAGGQDTHLKTHVETSHGDSKEANDIQSCPSVCVSTSLCGLAGETWVLLTASFGATAEFSVHHVEHGYRTAEHGRPAGSLLTTPGVERCKCARQTQQAGWQLLACVLQLSLERTCMIVVAP